MAGYGWSLVTTALLGTATVLAVRGLIELLSGGQATTAQYLMIISAGGALGGFAFSLVQPPGGKISLSDFGVHDRTIIAGVVGDVVIGLTAAYGIFFLLGSVFDFTPAALDLNRVMRLFTLGIAAGLGGKAVLARLPTELERRISQAQQEVAGVREEVRQANTEVKVALNVQRGMELAAAGELGTAEVHISAAFEEAPESPRALLGMAYLRRRQNLLPEAIRFCTQAIERDPGFEVAYYNRACYRCLSGQPVHEVLSDLQRAIELEPANRGLAQQDGDFTDVKENPQFRALVEG